jgi:hypothetical protein
MTVSWKLKERAIRALERDGIILTDDLINAARDPRHACHGDFTWDLTKAAQERWHDQARALIRQVSFPIEVNEITERIVNYVPTPNTDGSSFTSLPKLRSKAQVLAMLGTEISMLHGLTSRVFGLAVAKERIIGTETVQQLESIRGQLASLKEDLLGHVTAR